MIYLLRHIDIYIFADICLFWYPRLYPVDIFSRSLWLLKWLALTSMVTELPYHFFLHFYLIAFYYFNRVTIYHFKHLQKHYTVLSLILFSILFYLQLKENGR